MRTFVELSSDIGRFDLTTRKGRWELQKHIMHTWAIRDVYDYRSRCLPGGETFDFDLLASPAFANQRTKSLCTVFDFIKTFCLLHIGAKSILNEDFTIENVFDMTPHELGISIPPEKRKLLERLDIAARLDHIEGKVGETAQGVKDAAREGAKKAVETTLPRVYVRTASMSDAELRDATKPKTRSSGGGRKKERDLGDKQVKAALKYANNHLDIGLRAACDHIVRTMKDGDFNSPYMTAKDLDAAVRRYCKKTSRRIPSKTRSGRWSAKS